MKMQKIDIDQEVFNFLKNNAEPFVDTPNDVLRRLLLSTSKKEFGNQVSPSKPLTNTPPPVPGGTPKALEHILQVVYLSHFLGVSRSKATRIVSKIHDVAPQTVLDKYCRQLDLSASEFDKLISGTELTTLKEMLYTKFSDQNEVIDDYLTI